jgi:alpha-beta hydrolase superfamily lysophospholipase
MGGTFSTQVKAGLLDGALAMASGTLMLRDSLLGVTRGMRRHTLEEPFYFDSHGRRLAGVFVPGEPGLPVLLLCHGIGETVELWGAAQALLRDWGIGSMVFNYSGYGRSGGRVSAAHCDEDLASAYAELRRRVGNELPVYVLGFSLGAGIAACGVKALHPGVAGLFLCEGFPSFRQAVRAAGFPSWMTGWVPDVWRTAEAMRALTVPVCVMHSDGDRLFPVAMAEEIAAACGERGELVVVSGLAHNEPFLKAVERYWEPIVQRMLR